MASHQGGVLESGLYSSLLYIVSSLICHHHEYNKYLTWYSRCGDIYNTWYVRKLGVLLPADIYVWYI